MLHFANWVNPEDLFNPDNTAKYQPRAVVDDSIPGHWRCSWVPPAMLAPGVIDEGTWPRVVVLDGEQTLMERDAWDKIKLAGKHVCSIPQKGYPTAVRIRSPASQYRDDVPELDSDSESDASSEGTATPRVVPSSPTAPFTGLRDEPSLRPGSPMQSVVSRLYTAMSVDTHSVVSRVYTAMSIDTHSVVTRASHMSVDTVRPGDYACSSTGAPNAFGKRAKVQAHEHPEARPAKRLHQQKPRLPKTASARARRKAERDEYKRKRRALQEEIMINLARTEAAMREANHRAKEAHMRDLEEKRRRLQQIDQVERLAAQRFQHLEQERQAAAAALAARRKNPEVLSPQEAYTVWERRVSHFKNNCLSAKTIHIRELPFPVLFSPEYSLHLVDENSVANFFGSCAQFMTVKQLKKARVVLHDTHYRGKKYLAGELYKEEADTDFVLRVMTCVAAFVNDHFDELVKLCQK